MDPHRRLTDNMYTSSQAIRQIRKSSRRRDQLRERTTDRLRERVIHNYNETSPDEIRLHGCMVIEELVRKNRDLMPRLSKHQGAREALESEEVRTTLAKIGSIFVGTSGYNWELGTSRSTPHPLSMVPINSEFHNAELAHIVIKSHRRSAFDLQRARGKRCPVLIIIIFLRFNPPPNCSRNGMLLSLNLYSYGFYSTIGGCYYGFYYGIANYSYSQSQCCSNNSTSSSSSSVVSVPPKFLLCEYRIRYIPEPKGHYSMNDNNSYIAGQMGTSPVDKIHHKQHQQPSDSNASNKAVFKSKPSDKQITKSTKACAVSKTEINQQPKTVEEELEEFRARGNSENATISKVVEQFLGHPIDLCDLYASRRFTNEEIDWLDENGILYWLLDGPISSTSDGQLLIDGSNSSLCNIIRLCPRAVTIPDKVGMIEKLVA